MTVRLLLETYPRMQSVPRNFYDCNHNQFCMFEAMFTRYQIALTLARKPYRNEILFTNANGDFDAISVKDRAKLCRAEGGASHIG